MTRLFAAGLLGAVLGGGFVVAQGPGLRLHREWSPEPLLSHRVYAVCDEASGTMVYVAHFHPGTAMQIQPGGCRR